MEVIASPAAVDFVREHGGKLFVWSRSSRCCHGRMTFLEAATSRDDARAFRRVDTRGIDLYVRLPRLPERLEIDVHGHFRRGVRAYWDGCAWAP
jgi:hypothetical protein